MRDPPSPWRRLTTCPIGGLTEVGFTPDERYLLIVSMSGRGLLDLHTGARVGRDPNQPTAHSAWLDESTRTAEGIGPAQGVRVKVVGLWGGELPSDTSDGWRIAVERTGDTESVVLRNARSATTCVVDRPTTDVRAVGFSASGRFLVIATASDVRIDVRLRDYGRLPHSRNVSARRSASERPAGQPRIAADGRRRPQLNP
jgi:hypothetical protein